MIIFLETASLATNDTVVVFPCISALVENIIFCSIYIKSYSRYECIFMSVCECPQVRSKLQWRRGCWMICGEGECCVFVWGCKCVWEREDRLVAHRFSWQVYDCWACKTLFTHQICMCVRMSTLCASVCVCVCVSLALTLPSLPVGLMEDKSSILIYILHDSWKEAVVS